MKTIKAALISFVIAFTLFAAAPVVPPTGEVNITVNSSTNLNAAKLRVVGGRWNLDPDYTKWTTEIRLEAWNAEDPPEIAGRKTLTLTFNQMKNLYNSTNPSLALESSALNKANLVKK